MSFFNNDIPNSVVVNEKKFLVLRTRTNRQLTIYHGYIEPHKVFEPSTSAIIIPLPLKQGSTAEIIELSDKYDHIHRLLPLFPGFYMGDEYYDSVGGYKPMIANTFTELLNLKGFVLNPKREALLFERYGEGYGFLVCIYDPNEGARRDLIAVVHDLAQVNDGELFVPLRDHQISSSQRMNYVHIFTINACRNRGAGLVCKKSKKVKSILSEAGLDKFLPRRTVLRGLEINDERENEDLLFAVNPASLEDEMVHVVRMEENVVAIVTNAKEAAKWTPCTVTTYPYPGDIAPIMYVITASHKSEGVSVWLMSDRLEYLLGEFLLKTGERPLKELHVELLRGAMRSGTLYKLSIVVKADKK